MSTSKFVKEEGRIPRLNRVRVQVKVDVPKTEQIRVSSTSLRQGTAVTVNEWKTVNIKDRDKGLTWYDFSIDSLQVSGMISQLKYSVLNDTPMSVADGFDNVNVPVPEFESSAQNETTITE